ncbi:proline-rich protein 13-like [Nycticebus coucang]|uniref:proline-rich protein 13-like n=1 Tax=Nycticebus coucang TaxID=9470 RepID=UPI00234DEC4D|nr:proline-rich protein 13-like [Nycticebus coucang]
MGLSKEESSSVGSGKVTEHQDSSVSFFAGYWAEVPSQLRASISVCLSFGGRGWGKHLNMWNPNAGQPGPNPYPPNIRYPGGCNPAHLPPVNPVCPPGPIPAPPGVPQGNPAFPPAGPPHPVPQPGYPGCQPPSPYPPPYPPPAPGMPPVNPLAPGMSGPGMMNDKKMRRKMKKAHKKMHKHHKHGKHSSSSSSSSSSDSD